MLTTNEKADIDHEIAKFPVRKSACLDALLAVQKHRGYISDSTLALVADYMGMSPTELDGIATFYNLIYRKPVGEHVVRLCDSITCYILGYEDIKNRIEREFGITFGQTTTDNKITLLPAQCLGCCDKGCAMMVNEELYTNLTPEKVITVFKNLRTKEVLHGKAAHRAHEPQWTTP